MDRTPITEAFPWNAAPRYLIRDRDRIYGSIVARRMRAMGIRDKPIALASPWQNGFAERLIGSIRRECVDHFIVLGEAHLRHILRTYARYYNHIRTHWSLDKDAPVSRSVQRIGSINFTRDPRFSVHTGVALDIFTTNGSLSVDYQSGSYYEFFGIVAMRPHGPSGLNVGYLKTTQR
jgi:Integrase core domain